MAEFWQQLVEVGRSYLFGLIAPLAVLVIGWLVALLASSGIRRLLRRTGLDSRLGRWMAGDEQQAAIPVEKWAGRIAYYLIMLFVLVAFFQAVGLTMVTGPLTQMLTDVLAYAPRLISAGLLLLIAWVLAGVLRLIITRVLTRARVDERLGESAELRSGDGVSVSRSIASAVYWLVFLLFLPAVLSALALEGLLQPARAMLSEVVEFLPNLMGATIIILVGWFAARIVQRIVASLLAATSLDRIGQGSGLGNVLGQGLLSDLVGRVVYVLVLIPAVIMALDALDLAAVSNPASQMLGAILGFLPALFSAALIMLVAYLVGRLVSGLVAELLGKAGFNRILSLLGLSQEQDSAGASDLVGKLVLVGVLLFAAIEAANLLGFVTLSALLAQVTVFGSRILLALVVFGLGLYLANLVAEAVRSRTAVQRNLLATIARAAVVALFTAMALRQAGVANEIITSAFALLLGAIAVAVALAFGLGGREIAARQVEKWLRAVRDDEAER